MGTRAQVHIIDTGIYLYQHWDGYHLPTIVRNAMIRGKDRLNDDEYLSRIIFSEMIRDDIDGSTGYGIGNARHGDIEYLITVDIRNQRVKVEHIDYYTLGYSFSEFMKTDKVMW